MLMLALASCGCRTSLESSPRKPSFGTWRYCASAYQLSGSLFDPFGCAQDAATTLAEIEQETIPRDSPILLAFAEACARPAIIQHKDAKVKLTAACCLADVLRLVAPDVPYENTRLRSIFALFVEQLRGLERTDSASYTRCFQLLENLAVVQIFLLCVPCGFHDVVADLFRLLLAVSKCVSRVLLSARAVLTRSCHCSPSHSHRVLSYMTDMIASLLQEYEVIPAELLDILFEQLLPAQKRTESAALGLVKAALTRAAPGIANQLHTVRCAHCIVHGCSDTPLQYFSGLLSPGSSTASELGPHAYDLITELNSVAPSALFLVFPLLEAQLQVLFPQL
jgi:sister chromatid cohesion protein PDS5